MSMNKQKSMSIRAIAGGICLVIGLLLVGATFVVSGLAIAVYWLGFVLLCASFVLLVPWVTWRHLL